MTFCTYVYILILQNNSQITIITIIIYPLRIRFSWIQYKKRSQILLNIKYDAQITTALSIIDVGRNL